METCEKRLGKEEWGEIYNKEQLEQVINSVMTDQVFCWTEELLKISAEGNRMCEVGCGSGQSAAYLQKHGRNVTALDFSKECVELVDMVNNRMNLGMRVVCADATKPLPFEEKEFDYIYQCGLLEHYLRKALQLWLLESRQLGMDDISGQGYLLVTIGDCE